MNLTAASHVLHFDRWWNPAIENQATDRAFRIGQTRAVQVHKFVCSGTLEERIDAYEDIIDSEVGDTAFIRARNIERETGLRQIFLKFEGGNPTGTQKDRVAFAQAMDALRRGFDTITVATCGNFGVAVGLAASVAGLRCLAYIPESYHSRRIQEMESFGVEILRKALTAPLAQILVRGLLASATAASTRRAAFSVAVSP